MQQPKAGVCRLCHEPPFEPNSSQRPGEGPCLLASHHTRPLAFPPLQPPLVISRARSISPALNTYGCSMFRRTVRIIRPGDGENVIEDVLCCFSRLSNRCMRVFYIFSLFTAHHIKVSPLSASVIMQRRPCCTEVLFSSNPFC